MWRVCRRLRRAFRSDGVKRVWLVGRIDLAGVAAWFCTRTDRQRGALLERLPELLERTKSELLKAGFDPDQVARTVATVESRQTVRREHGGDWRMAMQ